MKWLFFILLLANLGMFILIYPQKAEKSDENSLPDIGELYLEEEAAELTADAGAVEQPVAATHNEPPAQGEPLPDEDPSRSGGDNQPPEPEASAGSKAALAPDIPTRGEEAAAEPDARVADAGEAPIETPAPAEEPVCATIGYLENRSDAEIVSVRLRALGLKPDLESETSNDQAGIWVLIPPQASRRKAIEIANRLERDGITDLWRFTSGELVHAISLGLFRNEERAEARRKEITDLGYEVMIKPRYRQLTKYWLYFQERTPAVVTEQVWGGLLADFPNLETKETACR
jgi:hypothetical protein